MDQKKKEAYLRGLNALREQYKKADQLSQAGQHDQAAELFRNSLEWASAKNFPLSYGMFVDLLTRLAGSLADLAHWDKTLPFYLAAEGALQDYQAGAPTPERVQLWTKLFPNGIKLRRENNLKASLKLASVYESMALVHDKLGHTKPSEEYYEQSIGINLDEDRLEEASQTIFLSAGVRAERQDWNALVDMADALVELSQRIQNREMIAAGFRFLAQAHINLDKEFLGLGYYADALNISDPNSPQYKIDRDETHSLIEKLTVRAINMNSVEALEPMVDAARAIGHPKLAAFESKLSAL